MSTGTKKSWSSCWGAVTPKFTPGPWHPGHLGDPTTSCECSHIVSETCFGAICTVEVNNGLRVSEGGNDAPPLEEAIANMHAISAVPLMFHAIQRQIENIENCLATGESATPEQSKSIYEQLVAARDAALGKMND